MSLPTFSEWMSRRPDSRLRRLWCLLVGHVPRGGTYFLLRCSRCWKAIYGETER